MLTVQHHPNGVPEKTVRLHDPAVGLDGYIVLHSTRLGPAAGGCRFWSYPTDGEACADALRLAEGMAFKNALAGLPLGGGKAVLRHPGARLDRRALFEAFGHAVNALGGEYVTAEDVGTTVADMETVSRGTRHVAGLDQSSGRPGGDPSPWTARGVFEAMKVALRWRLDKDLSEATVAVQGLGNVGFALCELLHEAGAKLIVADPVSERAARAAVAFGAEIADGRMQSDISGIGLARADVFAPCALGGALTTELATRMRARVVCGAANNQLATGKVSAELEKCGVLYAPDYLVNAGGIINVAAEYLGWDQHEVESRVAAIPARLEDVFAVAEETGQTTAHAAEQTAVSIIRQRSSDAVARAA